jgi:hypothetical protein
MQDTVSRLKQTFVAALVIVAVVAGMMSTVSTTSAARVPPGGDSVQRGCRYLQDLVIELEKEAGDPKTSKARKEQIRNQIENLRSDWRAIGCHGSWGDIAVYLKKQAATKVYSGPTKAVK